MSPYDEMNRLKTAYSNANSGNDCWGQSYTYGHIITGTPDGEAIDNGPWRVCTGDVPTGGTAFRSKHGFPVEAFRSFLRTGVLVAASGMIPSFGRLQ